MSNYCLFCNKTTVLDNEAYTCNNHNKVEVNYINWSEDFKYNFSYNGYEIDVFEDKIIIFHGYEYIALISADKTLTPDNLPQKLKTYLLFQ